MESGNVEGLEENLCSRITITPRIRGRFCQQYGMLHCRISQGSALKPKLLVAFYLFTQRLEPLSVNILPYFLHVVPVCNNAVCEGVVDL